MSEPVREGSGWSATCPCGWLEWNSRRPLADMAIHAHSKKCDGLAPTPKTTNQPNNRPNA